MINIMKQGNNATAYVTEYVADEESDVANLPTTGAPGSTCLVAATAKVYILNNKGVWVAL